MKKCKVCGKPNEGNFCPYCGGALEEVVVTPIEPIAPAAPVVPKVTQAAPVTPAIPDAAPAAPVVPEVTQAAPVTPAIPEAAPAAPVVPEVTQAAPVTPAIPEVAPAAPEVAQAEPVPPVPPIAPAPEVTPQNQQTVQTLQQINKPAADQLAWLHKITDIVIWVVVVSAGLTALAGLIWGASFFGWDGALGIGIILGGAVSAGWILAFAVVIKLLSDIYKEMKKSNKKED